MCRVARNAVAIVEVIAPSTPALRFAETLLPQKEPDRPKFAVFSEKSLKLRVSALTREVRCLHFDQYIDVRKWLLNSDLNRDTRLRIYDDIADQSGEVRDDMHIHFRRERLVMLRRMALVIGFVFPRSED
jgi:hypothetical protein